MKNIVKAYDVCHKIDMPENVSYEQVTKHSALWLPFNQETLNMSIPISVLCSKGTIRSI